MFSKQEKMYIQARASIGRWSSVRKALIAYTTVPVGGGAWEIITSHNLKLIFPYLACVGVVAFCQAICAGKVEKYQATVDILKKRLNLPPPVETS